MLKEPVHYYVFCFTFDDCSSTVSRSIINHVEYLSPSTSLRSILTISLNSFAIEKLTTSTTYTFCRSQNLPLLQQLLLRDWFFTTAVFTVQLIFHFLNVQTVSVTFLSCSIVSLGKHPSHLVRIYCPFYLQFFFDSDQLCKCPHVLKLRSYFSSNIYIVSLPKLGFAFAFFIEFWLSNIGISLLLYLSV